MRSSPQILYLYSELNVEILTLKKEKLFSFVIMENFQIYIKTISRSPLDLALGKPTLIRKLI